MKKSIACILAVSVIMSAFPIAPYAAYDDNSGNGLTKITYNYDGENHTRYMEKLDRGLVAVKTDNGVFLSWRLLGDEASVKDIIHASGFEVYKNGTLITTVTNSTNYLDKNGTYSDSYSVKMTDGEISGSVKPLQNRYLDIELAKPAPFTYSEGDNSYSYEYTAGDASCGDLDGDGQYEIVLKWDSNPQDNSNGGVTGNVLLDAYKLDGTRLWDKPIDLGMNIRSGAHYTQFLVYDFDGDGKAEITCKTAPGSKDASDNYVTSVSEDRSVSSADNSKSYVNSGGYILDGPEYFTIFNGEGAAVDTINYPVARVNASTWGDSYGNRVDRFIADVSYLDGERPYAVYWRGYYFGQSGYSGRCGVFAASFDGERLSVPEDHIFDTRSDQPGYATGNERYIGEGNHNMTSGDFDDDGRDEFTAGALAFEFDENDRLVPMWCTYKEHGDAIHIGDYDPTHNGLELFVIHEDGGGTNSYGGVYNDYGCSVIDPSDGSIIWHVGASKDTGRGLMANVGAGGYYQVTAASGVGGYYSLGGSNMQKGTSIGYNFRIFWDADLYDETLDGTTVSSWDGRAMSSVFNAGNYGCVSINGTKSVPVLQADLFGDWREELVFPTSDSNSLRIFTTTDVTDYKLPTLMHDPIYRSGVAAEQSGYNQPPHVGFYLADEIFRASVDHIEITEAPDKTTYLVGEPLDVTGLRVIAHFTDGSTNDVSAYAMVTGYDPTSAGEQRVTVTYSKTTAEFDVFVDSGFTMDDDGYITGYTLNSSSAILPHSISGRTVQGIRSGALKNSILKNIAINAEELDIENDAFDSDITIECVLGSDVYIYAVNSGLNYKTIDTRDFISDITYSENDYTGFGFRMGTSATTKTVGHITYGVGNRRNGGDSTTGYYISGTNDKYLLATAGRFSTRNRNLYFTVNDMPLATDSVDNVFETDIMFNFGGGTEAMLMVSDSSGNAVDFVSREYNGIENDVWYTYKLVYHNGSYYRTLAPKGEDDELEYIGTYTSESGVSRIDILPSNYRDWTNDLGKTQSAGICFDNTKFYTNVEIARLTLDITDENGNVLPNAKITIGDREYKSDRNGSCTADVLSGLYDVTVSAEGYAGMEFTAAVYRNIVEKHISLDIIRYPLKRISFFDDISLKVGQTAQTELITVPENAEKTVFVYSSSDESVVTVGEDGAVAAIRPGTATITAISQDDPDIKAECAVTVYEPYNSVVASIVVDGPDTAYIPNNSSPDLVQFRYRCYDKNGVEMKNVKGIKWTASSSFDINTDGILSVYSGTSAETCDVYASYGDVVSNVKPVRLISYPDSSAIIAYEDCKSSVNISQSTEVQSHTIGDITYVAGARASSGDNYSGFFIGNFNGTTCLQAKAGQFASAGREAYMVFDKIKDEAEYDTSLDYIIESDMYCTGTVKIVFEDSSGVDIMQLEPGVAGLNKNKWYHFMLIYSNGRYTQYVTDENGNYINTNLPTLINSGVIAQMRFIKGDTNYESVYFRGLKYYTAESAFSTITIKTVDADGASLPGITVNVSGNTLITDAKGVAKLTLPLGAYVAGMTNGDDNVSVGVMSMGANASYVLTMQDESAYEPVMTGIDDVIGKTIYASTNGEGLKLYAAKYSNLVLSKVSVFDTEAGTMYYTADFEPDIVYLWDAEQRPIDIWTR